MTRPIVRKLAVYAVMITFILWCLAIVGLGKMLAIWNATWIIITGLGLAYVLDKRLIAWFTPTQA